jgi:hypothetical protein
VGARDDACRRGHVAVKAIAAAGDNMKKLREIIEITAHLVE